jgi:hypothetical protein
LTGWNTPASQNVTIQSALTTSASATYVRQTGSLQVTLLPAGAVSAGAQWRRTGTTAWFNSGAAESGLPTGNYTVEFSSLTGWNTPASQNVTIQSALTTSASATYVRQTGSLQVTLLPAGAVSAGAQWRRTGTTAWFNSGAAESGILTGNYTVECKPATNWCLPANLGAVVLSGQTTLLTNNYGVPAWLMVNVSPASAVTAGAGWCLTGETGYRTQPDYTQCFGGVTNVQFSALGGWVAPTNQAVTLVVGQTNVVTGSYIVVAPVLRYGTATGLIVQGTSNTTYVIERSTTLPPVWTTNTTITLSGSSAVVPGTAPVPAGARFYRARWVP